MPREEPASTNTTTSGVACQAKVPAAAGPSVGIRKAAAARLFTGALLDGSIIGVVMPIAGQKRREHLAGGSLDHRTLARIAFAQCLREMHSLLERNMGRQRRDLRVGFDFQQNRPLTTKRQYPDGSETIRLNDIDPFQTDQKHETEKGNIRNVLRGRELRV